MASLRAILHGGVFKYVLSLSGAAGFAQVLALFASPILTRLYPPDAFGQLALFSAILALAMPVVTLRYEMAIPMPGQGADALALLWLCFVVMVVNSAALGVPALLLWNAALKDLAPAYSQPFVVLIPVAVFLGGAQAVLTAWLTRTHGFRQIAIIRFTTISTTLACQLGFGYVNATALDLIWSLIVGYAVGLVVALAYCQEAIASAWRDHHLRRMRRVAGRYRKFATITTPATVIDTLGGQLPNMALLPLYGAAAAGQFLLASRVVTQPMVMIGQPVFQVFWGRSARLVLEDPHALHALFVRLLVAVLVVMSPAVLLVVFGPEIFSFVFGGAWREAGAYAGIFVLAAIVGVPANATNNLNTYGRNAWQSLWQIAHFLLFAATFVSSWLFQLSAMQCIATLTAAAVLCYVGLICMNIVAIRSLREAAAEGGVVTAPASGERLRPDARKDSIGAGAAEWTSG
jgi:O-antigen/teichoic acid export membrane protein